MTIWVILPKMGKTDLTKHTKNRKITKKRELGALNLALNLSEGHFNDWAALTSAPLQALYFSALDIFTRTIGVAV